MLNRKNFVTFARDEILRKSFRFVMFSYAKRPKQKHYPKTSFVKVLLASSCAIMHTILLYTNMNILYGYPVNGYSKCDEISSSSSKRPCLCIVQYILCRNFQREVTHPKFGITNNLFSSVSSKDTAVCVVGRLKIN